jgi:hypothetical protein
LILLSAFSCENDPSIETEEGPEIDTLNLLDHHLNGDSVIAHRDTIEYWKWGDYKPWWYDDNPGRTTMRFKDFKFRIDGNFSKESWNEKDDTMHISEDVGWYLPGRSMWIDAENDSDKFEVYLAVEQRIWEQFDYKLYDDPNFSWEDWDAQSYERLERSEYYALEDSASNYRIHGEFTTFFHDRFLEEYEYDTCSNFVSSEGGGSYASFLINNKPCCWIAEYGIIKIIQTKSDGTKSEHFFKVYYSYGC